MSVVKSNVFASRFDSTTTVNSTVAPPTRSVSELLTSRPSSSSSLLPSQHYVIFCKASRFRNGSRLRNMFGLTGFAAYCLLLLAVFDPKQLPGAFGQDEKYECVEHVDSYPLVLVAGSLVNFGSVLLFSPVVFFGALPLFIHRKRTISTALPSASTLFAQLESLRRPNAITTLTVYLVAVAPIHFAYVWCTSYTSREPRLGWLFYHSGRDAYQINERRMLLLLLHLTLAAYATFDHVVNSKSRVQIDDGPARPIPQRLATRAQAGIPNVVRSVLASNALFYLTYIVLRRPILKFLVVNFAGPWARPYLYSLLKHNAAFSLTLASRSLMSSLLILGVWEAANVCFDVYASQVSPSWTEGSSPINISHFAISPNQCLLSGLRSTDLYYQVSLICRQTVGIWALVLTGWCWVRSQQFAFLELENITLTSPERRKAIFTDIKPDNARGGAWAEISRECLLLIGKELQRAKGRGKLPSPPPTKSNASASTSTSSHSGSSVPVRNENVFQPTKKTFLDTLAGSASTPAPTAKSSAVSTSSSSSTSTTSRVPSIFQTPTNTSSSSMYSVGTSVASAGTETLSSTTSKAPKSLEARLSSMIPRPWQGSLFTTLPTHVVDVRVARRRDVICAIRALSNLLCASLKEDTYGVAQRDIPRVLEGFVLYLNTLDALASSLSSTAESNHSKEAKEQLQTRISDSIGQVQLALREGIREILAEFEPFLATEFRKFPMPCRRRIIRVANADFFERLILYIFLATTRFSYQCRASIAVDCGLGLSDDDFVV
ncbi:BQ2448_2587 [Microbotryum intermedium]|uniref:BQ2448_2587 protein n=1 Tax=Microbotryum intermedium TaxID=269621 RepID=A0A238F8V8_9BASI|nr:BQ2448_2587 [Microbotryum intermedium]